MANTTISLRSSGVASNTPSLGILANGELSLNFADGIIYYKTAANASPLLRTTQTAELVAEQVGLPIIFDEVWYECSFGIWDGMSIDDVKSQYPDEYQSWVSSPAYAPPGGESYDALGWRIDDALNNLVALYPGQKVVVVTHNGVVREAIRLATGGSPESIYHIDISPCSISTIAIWPSDGLRALRGANERSHLL